MNDVTVEVVTTPTERAVTRKLTWVFIVGIIVCPIVFVWFTLRKGFSIKDRQITFVYLAALMILGAMNIGKKPSAHNEAADQQQEHATAVVVPRNVSAEERIDAYADRIAARGGICTGVAGQLRMVNNNFGAAHPEIAEVLGKAEHYRCL